MCHMMDSQRSHCQQIITFSVCCTCIPVTKWCHWYTGELHLSAAARPGGPGDKALLWSSWRRCWSETPPLLRASCLSWWDYPLWEAPWSLLCHARGGCAFSSCAHPPGTWHGELSMPAPLTCLLLIASLNNWGERRGSLVWENKNHLILQQNWKVCVRNLSNPGNLHN